MSNIVENLLEEINNEIPEVPDEGKTPGKAIERELSGSLQKIKNILNTKNPDEVKLNDIKKELSGKKTIKNEIIESINFCLESNLTEDNKEFTYDDVSDYVEDLKKNGFTDEKKLKGIFDKAKEIAAKQGKANDRKTIVGIMQRFFEEK